MIQGKTAEKIIMNKIVQIMQKLKMIKNKNVFKLPNQNIEYPIKGEIYSRERLEEYALYLGAQLKKSGTTKKKKLLLPRMKENRAELLEAYRILMEGINKKDTISPAGIWLTDNFHIVEDQLREIEEDLPPTYYKELPKINEGELAGYPRIYAIALALVAHTDSQLEPDIIRRFIQIYQTVCPLGIGELWALPITLRLALVENLRRTALRVVIDHKKIEIANLIADHLFESSGDQTQFQELVKELSAPCHSIVEEDCAYLAQVAKRLRDQEQELWPAFEHLEALIKKQNTSIEQVVNLSHQRQVSYQITIANIITSMRLISSLNWRDFFESISVVDRILEQDPMYGKMDFLTRDQYRHVIEKIGRRNGALEKKVAEEVVKLAHSHEHHKFSHVGYYLIDKGVAEIENQFPYQSKIKSFLLSLMRPNLIYFGLLTLLFIMAGALPLYYSLEQNTSLWFLVLIAMFVAIPCSELAVNLTNMILTRAVSPKLMPKLDLKLGVPPQAQTLVVVPCLLSSKKVIQELMEKLEIHYLGNCDPYIDFALLTDFTDAALEVMEEDDALLQFAMAGIEKLNKKYSQAQESKFFLFQRKRQWNSSEKIWMGWERKRGKIHELNQLLRGSKSTSFTLVMAPLERLPLFQYVITLDADTQLPRDAARKLIGTILHPLNKAYFDKEQDRVIEGYGILQPRIGVSLESSSRSPFAKLFSGYTGLDPYTTAVSDVYQDLFREGSFTGKGLYEIDTFEMAMAHRAPENCILSHDLFEGLYCRVGLVSDIELLDDYPQSYRTFVTRLHRWTRGDWQIAAWAWPWVKKNFQAANLQKYQWGRNLLPLVSRWKIVDNLRRSLVMPATFILFIMAWTVLPGEAQFWFAYLLFLMIFPIVFQWVLDGLEGLWQKKKLRLSTLRTKITDQVLPLLLYFIFLPHLAYVQIDAMVRVFYRQRISKRQLLEWVPAAQAEMQKNKTRALWQAFWPTEVILLGVTTFFVLLTFVGPYDGNVQTVWMSSSLSLSSPLLLMMLWVSHPLVARWLSRPVRRTRNSIKEEDQLLLRQIARRTWHYFETFVGHEDHWLPPDNHQEFPTPVTAHRTSPTNIGLYILSLVSARDFGYINTSSFITRLRLTLLTMHKLERFQGHYLNWYDTQTLTPLEPKYVSTVDSGNLAGHLVAGRQACLEIPKQSLVNTKMIDGLRDSLLVIEQEFKETKISSHDFKAYLQESYQQLTTPPVNTLSGWYTYLNQTTTTLEKIKSKILKIQMAYPEKEVSSLLKWINMLLLTVHTTQNDIADTSPWVLKDVNSLNDHIMVSFPVLAPEWKEILDLMDVNGSLSSRVPLCDRLISLIQEMLNQTQNSSSPLFVTLSSFLKKIKKGKVFYQRLIKEALAAADFMDKVFKQMNFNFLLDPSREIFAIGYKVAEGVIDNGLYDLLGSESRLASLIAIAKGDVPQEHWFRLGRQLVPVGRSRALVSWTASMFEYLMPLLVMRDYENTLLYETTHSVVARQIRYGKENKIPWGISEAGYNARDLQLNYQYGPFGIPGLGLKRGLSHDLVVSPYSTMLAAMVEPKAAIDNMKRLIRDQLLKNYGFYEAVDFTPERLPPNETRAVIQSFMAHHQGMSFIALNNVLHDNPMPERFHRDPRIRTTRLLLQEKIPGAVITTSPKAAEIELEGARQPVPTYFARHHTNPNSDIPQIQLLSNQHYSLMISAAGGGYSKCHGLAVTRWKEDATRDIWGSYIFVRDHLQGKLWSTAYQPFAQPVDSYKATFGEDKVEFRRRDGDITTHTQILVTPKDNVEIRFVTLTNHSSQERVMELTSYWEPVLGFAANDAAHPAFSKLFIQTEFLSSKSALLAHRRKRSENDREVWGLHAVVTDGSILGDIQYETDRAQFIGRGHTLQNAMALIEENQLSNSLGATLDPIMSLRVKVKLPAQKKIQVSFTAGLAFSRAEALELEDRYHDINSFDRESKIAWTKSQVDMRHLNIDSKTSYLCQRLAERILFSETSLRPPSHIRAATTDKQSSLWPSGISGDLPIAVVMISHLKDITQVRSLLRCHEYLRLRGLVYDFVIINDHASTYYQDLQDELQRQILSMGLQSWLNKNGGIFILRKDITPEKDLAHIKAVARILLLAHEPLKEQLKRKAPTENYPKPMHFEAEIKTKIWGAQLLSPELSQHAPLTSELSVSAAEVAVSELGFFNGWGGFTKDGKEYVIQLRAGQWTPAPWINVIGNRLGFGFQVSEVGSGFTWCHNSQTHRLTPWSNDPVSDPSGEIIYLRDDETGEIWNPTPLPIRGSSTYNIRHGQGYSIFESTQEEIQTTLTMFVPKDQSIKVSILKLKNLSQQKRNISVTGYTEWVLGTQREKTAPYLVCDADHRSSIIFARNPHDNEFATRVAFADISKLERTFTCSRKEFLGRNGNYTRPAGLLRQGFSQRRGTGNDPCAVLQTALVLEAGEEYELLFLLGESDCMDSARALSLQFRDLSTAKTALAEVVQEWNDFNDSIQVQTPELAMNLMMNQWLLYQTLSCRYWSRTAFYQSGGAYGFRDQLQDSMAFVYANPSLTREHILRASSHQFVEGDVQHWWHPPSGHGIRTRMTDDLLWLPFVVSFYVKVTGDKAILEEKTSFLEAPLLKAEEEDAYGLPLVSKEKASLLEHCIRAINRSLSMGEHGLPLIGTGDWNDGMNQVGSQGKGESIWLGWFLYKVLSDFLPLCGLPEHKELRGRWMNYREQLKVALEKHGWDGEWYRRAYFDDGTPLGSAENEECQIDSISQTWAVLSGAGDKDRTMQSLLKVVEYLVKKQSNLILLLTPPFDKMTKDPGYIKGYVPGVRENGGQYSHAAAWVIMAFAELADGDTAFELFKMINPIQHSYNRAECEKYKIEPYVLAGDVYAGSSSYEGRGGWSWYTGSASWYYRAGLESILGFHLEGNKVKLKPCIPTHWKSYEIRYKYKSSNYFIQVHNPEGLSSGNVHLIQDGVELQSPELELINDGEDHHIVATIVNFPSDALIQKPYSRPLL